jgi:hypothetical protein
MEVSVQLHAPAALTPVKRAACTHRTGNLVGKTAHRGGEEEKIPAPIGDRPLVDQPATQVERERMQSQKTELKKQEKKRK